MADALDPTSGQSAGGQRSPYAPPAVPAPEPTSPQRTRRRGLLLILGGLIPLVLFGLLQSLLPRALTGRASIVTVSQIVWLAALVPMLIGLVLLTALPAASRSAGFVWTALVGHAVLLVLELLELFAHLSDVFGLGRVLFLVYRVVVPVAEGALVLALWRLGRWRGRAAEVVLALVVLPVLLLGSGLITWNGVRFLFGEVRPASAALGIVGGILSQLARAMLTALVAVAAISSAAVAEASRPPGPGEPLLEPGWLAAARGLLTYRTGLLLRLLVTLVGLALVFLASQARSLEAVRALIFLVPLVTLLTSAVALVGLINFARLPVTSGGRGLTVAALALMGLGLVGDLYVLSLLGQIAFGQPSFRLLDEVQRLEPVGLGLALVSGLLLLGALWRVARGLQADEARRRAGIVAGLMLALIPLLALLKTPQVVRELGASALLLALPVLALAITTIVLYLGLLRELGRAIQDRAGVSL